MDYGRLPVTGMGIVIGGVLISQSWLIVAAVAAIGLGTLLIRFGWRRGKTMSEH